MIPKKKNAIMGIVAKYGILENGDIMKKGDEYYNNFYDAWFTIEKENIGYEFCFDESKPVRRKFKDR